MKNDWLKDIHDKMTDFETDGPQNLWEEICSQIEKTDFEYNRRSGKSVFSNLYRLAASAAAIAAIVICVIELLPLYSLQSRSDLIAGNDTATTDKTVDPDDECENFIIDNTDPSSTTASAISLKHAIAHSIPPTPDHHCAYEDTENKPNSVTEDKTDAGNTDLKTNASENCHSYSDSANLFRTKLYDIGRHDYCMNRAIADISGIQRQKVSVSVFSTAGTGSEINRKSISTASVSVAGPENSKWNDSPLLGILTYNQGLEVTDDVKHHLPIKAGVSLAFRLNERIVIESGVVYTNLTSDIYQGSESHYLKGRQSLHYVGIPLNLKVNIVSWKGFDIYASAGPMIEKCVAGSYSQSYILNGNSTGKSSADVEDHPFQWSVNLSAGLQFNINSLLGIYAEPGAAYYFDDGSSLKTIYKEKPLNFNLNLGVRLSFGN